MNKSGAGVPSPTPNRLAASPARGLNVSLGRIIATAALSLVVMLFVPASAWAGVIVNENSSEPTTTTEAAEPESTGTAEPEPAGTDQPAPPATDEATSPATDEPEPKATDSPGTTATDEPEPTGKDEPVTLAEDQFNLLAMGLALLITITSINTVRGFRR